MNFYVDARSVWPEADQIELIRTEMHLTGAVNRTDIQWHLIAWHERERWVFWPFWKRKGLERIGQVRGRDPGEVLSKLIAIKDRRQNHPLTKTDRAC
jgi:hypothetical protein